MSRVLLLNASYEAITTVTWQRAIILTLEGLAEVIEEGDTPIRSQRLTLTVPKVIRLAEYRQVPFRARSPLTRRGVLVRDGHRCCYCTRRKATTVDHVVPRSRKGMHRWENVVASCSPCNARKDDRTPDEAGMEMRFLPSVPSGNLALIVAVGAMDEAWRPYLDLVA